MSYAEVTAGRLLLPTVCFVVAIASQGCESGGERERSRESGTPHRAEPVWFMEDLWIEDAK